MLKMTSLSDTISTIFINYVIITFISAPCHGAAIHFSLEEIIEFPSASDRIRPLTENFHCDETYYNSSNFTDCVELEGESLKRDITEDGFLYVNGNYYAPGQFCTYNDFAKICPSPPVLPWRKCCGEDQIIDSSNSLPHCVNSPRKFRPSDSNGELMSFQVSQKQFITCRHGFHLKRFSTSSCAARSKTSFKFSPDGTISYEVVAGLYLRNSQWKMLEPISEDYCVDGAIDLVAVDSICSPERNSSSNATYSVSDCLETDSGEMTSVLYICEEDEHPEEANNKNVKVKSILLSSLWLFSCPLLLGAALANSCVIQKNVHGWILTCYLLSMLILNILSALVICSPTRGHEKCRPIDFLIKFVYMSTLCWMTSINFGLCKTFRFEKNGYSIPQPVGLRRFLTSLVFSLGFPALSLTVCYCVIHHGGDYGRCKSEYCFLYSFETIPFYSLPIYLMVLGNFAIFLKTTYTITSLRNETKDILREQAQDHLQSFGLFTKLFLLSGSIWLLRLFLFVLQILGMYLSWYGVFLEVLFSVPEILFPIIIFHHAEFIKWSWNNAPELSRFIRKFDPFFSIANSPGMK